ncbi:uncharacterized protein LOC129988483 [Argiope bruennichi]|uniref:Ribosome-binding factor A n=1 Tax=Argiope bruennichi TaxID=94029 RepID=A0A8T0EC24_ARGBR|nr:uncharacterized protein LOC129988483 [Argiope bruennichi]KAF8770259.1 hypothetical protein HNY73_017815 [Argiope bruennichi]
MNLFGDSVLHKIRCFHLGIRSVCEKVNPITKRGSMLAEMIKNTDKRKHWHFEILQNNAKSKNVFEKVSRPSRRQNVLNALFIRNITDVLSTGDTIPEIIGSGIEITGVKIAPCCRILNVYWQIPQSSFAAEEIIATALNGRAHKIRAELISRNVMGRVPQIFFIRDTTNAYVAAFEKAIQEVEEEMKSDSGVVPDDSFMSKKKLYKFTDSKQEKEREKETKVKVTETIKDISVKPTVAPARPVDMRADVFGLNHDQLMTRVNAQKTKIKLPEKTNVITAPEWAENETVEDDDIFSKIPGTTVHSDSNREELLKKFQIERKKRLQDKRKKPQNDDGPLLCEENETYEEPEFNRFCSFDDDFVEEDTPERFQ